MNLKTVLQSMTLAARDDYARRVGVTGAYLWHVATGFRRASPELARRMVDADSRLTLSALRPDLWGRRNAPGSAGPGDKPARRRLQPRTGSR